MTSQSLMTPLVVFFARPCIPVFLLILGAVNLGFLPTAFAGGGPENVVVIVNADSASSKLIANTYIHGRGIPSRNVIYLNGIPEKQIIDFKPFREKILEPIIREIEARRLAGSVDYIVYSSGFPTTIRNKEHFTLLKEKVEKLTGGKFQDKIYRPNASITTLTYFAAAVLQDEPGYFMLDANAYYRHPAQVLLRRPFFGDRQKRFQEAIGKIKSSDEAAVKASISLLEDMAKKNPEQLACAYWLAKFYAMQGDARKATQWLTQAVRLGWCFQQQTKSDLAFEKVKDDSVFQGIVERIADQPFDFVPTHGFKQSFRWGANGMVNREPGQGNKYFLSTVLAVTRNHGTTEKQALKQIKRTMRADETFPKGTFYFTNTGDVRVTTRKPNYDVAINALKLLGQESEIVDSVMPNKKKDVIGLVAGTSSFNWTKTGSRILPGAICTNLTSFGGVLDRPGQTKLSEFIANGAGGASGTVVEPYALQQKFAHPMIHAHYVRGCSLAEAYYQSVHGPHQLLIVGDALCQPWAKKPVLEVDGLTAGETTKGKTELVLDASKSPVPIGMIELYVDGIRYMRIPMRERISFDSSNMTDGYHEVRIVAVAKNSIQTTGSVVLPIKVNNKNIETTLTPEHKDYLETDKVRCKAVSNYGDSIELKHNGRSLAKRIGRDVSFEIPASLLGRGPVRLEAVAIAESGKTVASMPVELEIKGRISDRKKNTETNKK